MKKIKIILSSIFILICLVNLIKAELVSDVKVTVNGINIDLTKNESINLSSGSNVSINILFTAIKDQSDVKVDAYILGFDEDIHQTTPKFNLINNTNYVKNFSFNFPNSANKNNKIKSMQIKISSKDETPIIYTIGINLKSSDTTTPEALIKLDSKLKDLVVLRKDDVDNNVQVNYTEECLVKKIKNCLNKIRIYEIKDNSNNTLTITIEYTKLKDYVSIRILNLKYNNKNIKQEYNLYYLLTPKSNIFSQQLIIKNERAFIIYNKNKNKSEIFLSGINNKNYKNNGEKSIVIQTKKGKLLYSLK